MAYRYRVKEVPVERPPETGCHHHWIIESAGGPTSTGVCKLCGVTKDFFNAFSEETAVKKDANPLKLPLLPDVKLEEEDES